jgi:hypothetical protein
MDILSIFEDGNGDTILASSRYDGDLDEFARLFRDWQDPEYLESFFSKHHKDLGFFGNPTVEEAILETIRDAKLLESKMIRLSKKVALDEMFNPLYPGSYEVELVPSKAYGNKILSGLTSWLRIYAIKLEDNVYVITGGMIKLTEKIQDRPHGSDELDKIQKTKAYLKSKGMFDQASLKE